MTAFVLSLVGAAGVVAAAPAASAADSTSTATVCFRETSGGAWTEPVNVNFYVDGWHPLALLPGDDSGCHTYVTPDNVYIQFVVDHHLINQARWTGAYYKPPGHHSHVGATW